VIAMVQMREGGEDDDVATCYWLRFFSRGD